MRGGRVKPGCGGRSLPRTLRGVDPLIAPPPAWFGPLLAAVERAFLVTGADTPGWPDPHPGPLRSPRDEEYSRVTDVGKYRILGARVDAWVQVLAESGLAEAEDVPAEPWIGGHFGPGDVARVRRLAPRAPGGLVLLFASTLVDGSPFGLEVGIAHADEQPVCVGLVPDCGCDACDSGSADLLEVLDGWVLTVARGGVVHARLGDRSATRTLHGWSASGDHDRSWLDEETVVPDEVVRWIGTPWSHGIVAPGPVD